MSRRDEAGFRQTSPGLELLRVAGLAVLFLVQLAVGSRLAGASRLDDCLTKPFWLDEFHTLALVKEERVDQLLSKLSRGGDVNPPALHLALWTIAKVAPCSDEILLRAFSCVVGFGGLVATYFLLRRSFRWTVSAVAVLGTWSSSPLLIEHMFEGRFYSFWFAATALLCLLLCTRKTGLWRTVGVAAAAVLLCAIHYFAIIGLALITICQFGLNGRDRGQRRMCLTALGAGIVTVIALLPLYFGQRAALPGPTWIEPPTLRACAAFLDTFGLTYAMTIPVLAYALEQLLSPKSDDSSGTSNVDFRLYAGVCGLILLPVAVVVFSYVIQPAQITRYALPAVLAYAPLIALCVNRVKGAVLAATGVAFFIVGLRGPIVVYRANPDYRQAAPVAKAATVERPLVVHSRHVAYPLARYTGVNPQVVRVSFLFRGKKLTRLDESEQAVARLMGQLFNLPRTLEPTDLASLQEFVLLVPPGEEQRYRGWVAEPTGLVVDSLRAYKMRRAGPVKSSRHAG